MPEKKKYPGVETDYMGVHARLYRRITESGRDGWSSPDEVAVMLGQLERARQMGGFPQSGRMLELGCGDGCFTIAAAKAFGYRITGLDVVPMAVSLALKRTETAGLPVGLAAGSVLDLPWPDETFDLAVDSHCFHCIIAGDRRRFLAEAFRVLKPGGALLVMTMANDPPKDIVPHFDPETRCEIINNTAVRYYGRPEGIYKEVEAAGFEIAGHWLLPAVDKKDQDELIVVGLRPVS